MIRSPARTDVRIKVIERVVEAVIYLERIVRLGLGSPQETEGGRKSSSSKA